MTMLKQADRSKPWGEHGTVGSTTSGRKPREQQRDAMHGVKTQGAHSGHENCRHCSMPQAQQPVRTRDTNGRR